MASTLTLFNRSGTGGLGISANAVIAPRAMTLFRLHGVHTQFFLSGPEEGQGTIDFFAIYGPEAQEDLTSLSRAMLSHRWRFEAPTASSVEHRPLERSDHTYFLGELWVPQWMVQTRITGPSGTATIRIMLEYTEERVSQREYLGMLGKWGIDVDAPHPPLLPALST